MSSTHGTLARASASSPASPVDTEVRASMPPAPPARRRTPPAYLLDRPGLKGWAAVGNVGQSNATGPSWSSRILSAVEDPERS